MTGVCYQYLSASGQNVNLLQVPGDLVVRPVEHPQLPGVVCPVEEVEQQECEGEEKSEVAIIYYDRLCRLTWQNYQFWKLN